MTRRRGRGGRLWARVGLIAAALLLGEGAARLFHDMRDADFLFNWYFFDTRWERERRAAGAPPGDGPGPPPGAPPSGAGPPPGAGVPLTADEYRGSFRLDAPPDPTRPRIIATGAGHLFAQDIPWGRAWPERVSARMREAGLPVEVWNLAVPGSTVLFVERGQLDAIVAARPDVVVLGHGGFNEALYAGIPEAWVLHPSRPAVNLVLSSALVRFVLLRGSRLTRRVVGAQPTVKVPVPTFKRSLGAVVARLRDAEIGVVLLQQVVIHPDLEGVWSLAEMEPFRDAVAAVGAAEGVAVIDPADAFTPPLTDWFERQEYYNAAAHNAIAQQIVPALQARVPDPRHRGGAPRGGSTAGGGARAPSAP